MDTIVAKTDRRKHPVGTFLDDLELEQKLYSYKNSLTGPEKIEEDLWLIKGFLVALRDGYANTSQGSINKTIKVLDGVVELIKKD